MFSASGAISLPPDHGPLIEEAVKTLFGLARQPVLPETIRKYTPPTLNNPGASYAPAAVRSE